jgi:hypothetical protein
VDRLPKIIGPPAYRRNENIGYISMQVFCHHLKDKVAEPKKYLKGLQSEHNATTPQLQTACMKFLTLSVRLGKAQLVNSELDVMSDNLLEKAYEIELSQA